MDLKNEMDLHGFDNYIYNKMFDEDFNYIPVEISETTNLDNSISYVEMKSIISKVWINSDDIMKLAQCGKHTAVTIRDEIEKQIISQGKHVPKSAIKCVPTHLVLEYLGLDIDLICKMAERFA